MTIQFTETARPAVTRKSAPNEFLPLADALAADRDKTLGFTVEVPAGEDAKKHDAKIRRQMAEAAKPHGITIRATVVENAPKTKGGKVTLTYSAWSIDKIARKPKAKKG